MKAINLTLYKNYLENYKLKKSKKLLILQLQEYNAVIDSPILEYSDSLAFTLKGYSDSWPFTHDDNSGNNYDEMVEKLFVPRWTTRNKSPSKKAKGRLRQSEVVFLYTRLPRIVPSHVVQPGICPVLIQNRYVFDRAIVISDKKCTGNQHCLRQWFWFQRNIALPILKDCLDL